MFDSVTDLSTNDPTQLIEDRMFDVMPEHVNGLFKGKGRLAEISRVH